MSAVPTADMAASARAKLRTFKAEQDEKADSVKTSERALPMTWASDYLRTKTAFAIDPKHVLTGAGIGAAAGLARERFAKPEGERSYLRGALGGAAVGGLAGGAYSALRGGAPAAAPAPAAPPAAVNDLAAGAGTGTAAERAAIGAHNKSIATQLGLRPEITRNVVPAGYEPLHDGSGWINPETMHVLSGRDVTDPATLRTMRANLGNNPMPSKADIRAFAPAPGEAKINSFWAAEYVKKAILLNAGLGAGVGALAAGAGHRGAGAGYGALGGLAGGLAGGLVGTGIGAGIGRIVGGPDSDLTGALAGSIGGSLIGTGLGGYLGGRLARPAVEEEEDTPKVANFVGQPVGYGRATLTGGGIGAALGGLAGGLLGGGTSGRELGRFLDGAGIGAGLGGLAGAGIGALYAKDQRDAADGANAFMAMPIEAQQRLMKIRAAYHAGVPLSDEAHALLATHGPYLDRLERADVINRSRIETRGF